MVYIQTGLKFVIDSVFSTLNHDFLIKSLQDYLTADAQFNNNINDQIANIAIKREARSMCQSAEWGMRALQSSFPCMLERLVYEERGELRIIMKMMILLSGAI